MSSSCNSLVMPSLVLTSAWMGMMAPLPSFSSLAAAWIGSNRRPVMYTLHPFSLSAVAVVRPRPVPPPVTFDQFDDRETRGDIPTATQPLMLNKLCVERAPVPATELISLTSLLSLFDGILLMYASTLLICQRSRVSTFPSVSG